MSLWRRITTTGDIRVTTTGEVRVTEYRLTMDVGEFTVIGEDVNFIYTPIAVAGGSFTSRKKPRRKPRVERRRYTLTCACGVFVVQGLDVTFTVGRLTEAERRKRQIAAWDDEFLFLEEMS